jgi:hypothetical protein
MFCDYILSWTLTLPFLYYEAPPSLNIHNISHGDIIRCDLDVTGGGIHAYLIHWFSIFL